RRSIASRSLKSIPFPFVNLATERNTLSASYLDSRKDCNGPKGPPSAGLHPIGFERPKIEIGTPPLCPCYTPSMCDEPSEDERRAIVCPTRGCLGDEFIVLRTAEHHDAPDAPDVTLVVKCSACGRVFRSGLDCPPSLQAAARSIESSGSPAPIADAIID